VEDDQDAGLADIIDGMGRGLAEWIVVAPSWELMLQTACFGRDRTLVIRMPGHVFDLNDVTGGSTARPGQGLAHYRERLNVPADLIPAAKAELLQVLAGGHDAYPADGVVDIRRAYGRAAPCAAVRSPVAGLTRQSSRGVRCR
jgi:hypothetical protein